MIMINNGKNSAQNKPCLFLKYIFSDILRHNLKLKNLGKNAIKLLEKEIVEAKKFGFKFKTVNQMHV